MLDFGAGQSVTGVVWRSYERHVRTGRSRDLQEEPEETLENSARGK